MKNNILAMYDVRGIQDYIFRTSKVKEYIGGSGLVETIIADAMSNAIEEYNSNNPNSDFSYDIDWFDKKGPCSYSEENEKSVQVLYDGGGNAFFTFKDEALCISINKSMSKYILENTYSLVLAVAYVKKTGDYEKDYKEIFKKMNETKENMPDTRPLGALPIMKRDIETGLPTAYKSIEENSTETEQKREREIDVRKGIKTKEKIFDEYIQEKNIDSTLAIVHIDGNNMGLRIRKQVERITNYDDAVKTMRMISYRIRHSYNKVFFDMKKKFDSGGEKDTEGKRKNCILKILVAGDDITYVCTGKIAINTVRYFAEEISKYTMDGKKALVESESSGDGYEYLINIESDKDKLIEYGFSVCSGIAFIHSHFPFSEGYEVAEACCESAKKRAKNKKYMYKSRVANWVDFQICKNTYAKNLKKIREDEFFTSSGENLLIRPYFISTKVDTKEDYNIPEEYNLEDFVKNVEYFKNEKNFPKSFAKELRNIYPLGKKKTLLFETFLDSREWKYPKGDKCENNAFIEYEDGKCVARYYDALEMLDLV